MSTLSYHFSEFAIGAVPARAHRCRPLRTPVPCRQDAQRSSELLDSLLSCVGIPSVPPPGRILSTPTRDKMRIVPNQVA